MTAGLLDTRAPLFPDSLSVERDLFGDPGLHIGGCDLHALAEAHGTPLYLLDQHTLDTSVSAYRQALAAHYPAPSAVTYAGKAYLSLAMAQWAQQANLWLDCTGLGELYIAAAAGFPTQRTLVHGVNKSRADLHAALQQASVIVVDNLDELADLAHIGGAQPAALPRLWLRFRPGLAVETHKHTQTGQEDSKFGMSTAEIHQAVAFCIAHKLPLTGLHFHQGSHFHDPEPVAPAIQIALDLVAAIQARYGWLPETICPGGGWGVAYHEHDLPHPDIETYVQFIASRLVDGCRQRGLPLPTLHLEPGRSLIARAGVAVYRLGKHKRSANINWWLLDGGLADNPRVALYGARYSALPVRLPDRPAALSATLAGPYCESGDILIEDLPMPELQTGELVAVPVAGAYQLSMSSNYNGALRPAVLLLHAGKAVLIQRREQPADLTRRDLPLVARV